MKFGKQSQKNVFTDWQIFFVFDELKKNQIIFLLSQFQRIALNEKKKRIKKGIFFFKIKINKVSINVKG